MKVKDAEGNIREVEDGYQLKSGEGFEDEEDGSEEEKKLVAIFEKRAKELVTELFEKSKNAPPSNVKDLVTEKSVIETDPTLRKQRPFVSLSPKMVSFVNDIKSLARGETPTSLKKTMTEGIDTDGGFLVPEEFNAEVIRHATESAVVRPRARVLSMARDLLSMPVLDQSEDQFAGIELHWISEGDLKEDSNPTFTKLTLQVKELIGLVPVSDSLLADSAVNLANFLVSLFGEAIAYEEDKQFLTGNGMGKPLGIIEGSCNLVHRETEDHITYEDLKHMMTALPAWADSGAVWLTTKAGLEELLDIKSGVYDGEAIDETKGFPLLLPGFNLANGVPPTVLGYSVILTDKLPALGTKGDICLANLGYYYIGDRGPLAVASSMHDRFRYNETTFRFVKRVDGQPAICDAFVVLDDPARE